MQILAGISFVSVFIIKCPEFRYTINTFPILFCKLFDEKNTLLRYNLFRISERCGFGLVGVITVSDGFA